MVFLHAPINYRSGLRDMDLHMDLLDDAFTSYSCMMIMCNAGVVVQHALAFVVDATVMWSCGFLHDPIN